MLGELLSGPLYKVEIGKRGSIVRKFMKSSTEVEVIPQQTKLRRWHAVKMHSVKILQKNCDEKERSSTHRTLR